ncbi:hypothetical protein PPYR_02442 [Photinus pyralis]|uniref:RING-type E3 ubiquitin transferase n=1 Tax=Photinus pyralis TaxID=7054 RepID=A0A1Y1NEE7_PHOPY|nr:E3 ubiquitin-protein ligase synoviolin-like [Photinus pyralis]XP_031351917.1 E3 ubiquitin-protein ligase synoviolin-like [Photinus pyralis]KAB0805457.1 hypothetical protein PPYR_02427 [Photinus pyralis]KAB0805472.1 hypothetical protein PPYR_02442 [Photinus pyralis]
MRSVAISVLSVVLTTVVLANAYYQKKQFYPSVVYITKSNPSMAVIYIQAFILVFLTGKLMRKVFFGQLRTAEFEHLMERAWYAITETCLAFTVFRDDFTPKFVALFTILLFLKSFHWLAEDRIDYMERSPVISWVFHIRVLSLLLVLGTSDFYFLQHAYLSTMAMGPSVQLVFGFEYAILLTMVANIALKYVLHTIDLNSEAPWANKAVFLLYTELVMGLIKVVLYIAFLIIMIKLYTLPLFAFRPMYYTLRNFKKAFNNVILSRRAIHNMNTLYADATPEELQAADNVCIICREEMTTSSKKLPCNHIFHTACLRSWFQRQQTCPTCRLNILRNPATARAEPRPQAQPMPNPFAGPPFVFQPLINPMQDLNQGAAAQPPPTAPPTSTSQSTTQQGPVPPFALPPFMPFPFLPFMSPPPMPSSNLASLSAEELRRMEGNEREHVEARIRCLQNIQVMLDAAVLMMNQYSAAVATSGTIPSHPPTDNVPPAANDSSNTSKESEGGTSSSSNSNASIPATSSANPLSAEEEIRRRRLQRFEQTVEQQQ